MFDPFGRFLLRRGWLIVGFWTAALCAALFLAPRLDSVSRDDDVRFFPPEYLSVVGQDLLERGFPRDADSSQVVVVVERTDGLLSDSDLRVVDDLTDLITKISEDRPRAAIKRVVNHRTPIIGARLRRAQPDGRGEAVLVMTSMRSTYLAKQTRVAVDHILEQVNEYQKRQPLPAGMLVTLTGSAVVGHDLNQASNESIATTTRATILLVVLILLVVYRSPLLALIPLITIAISVFVSMRAIASLTLIPGLKFQVINITDVFLVVVLFGAGTDYCLFLISRYREELARGLRYEDAMREAIHKVGGALVASAGTVICGLGMLWFSSFAKIRYTGPSIGLSLAIGLIAALSLAPLMVLRLRGVVFWPFKPPHPEPTLPRGHDDLDDVPLGGFWLWVANRVVQHPAWILLASLSILVPLAIVGAGTQPNYSQLADLGAGQPSVIGSKRIERYFAVGELSPTSILIHHPGLNFLTDSGQKAIAEVCGRLALLPDVAEIRSVTQPLGKPSPGQGQGSLASPPSALSRLMQGNLQPLNDMLARNRYVSIDPEVAAADQNHITRIEIAFGIDPFSIQSLESLERVRTTMSEMVEPGGPLAKPKSWGFTGATASIEDLKTVTTQDERRMYWLVTLGVYLILVLLLRRPWICVYLIVTVVIGYLASLGLTELVFQYAMAEHGPWGGLDWKVGFFLFVILIAVGEDYNIFLMSRVLEEQAKHGVVEGTRRAIAHTGGIISSCGLIMAGTFGSMLTGTLAALRELGFALATGVMLDTFVVRPILVPAFIILLERWREHRRRA